MMRQVAAVSAALSMAATITISQVLEHTKRAIDEEFSRVPGTFALAWEDLQNGRQLRINDTAVFHAASTMKVAVMIEVFRQAARGYFSLDDTMTVRNEFRSIVDGSRYSLSRDDDSDTLVYSRLGRPMTIRELVYQMITLSSNLATNLLVEMVGASNVTATAGLLGAAGMQVLRGVEDQKAYDRGMNNTTTARDLLALLKAIAMGKAVDRTASGEMFEILSEQKLRDKIPALLPPDVRVANKTGSFRTVQHDAGIVTLPDGRRYVLVVLSRDLENDDAGRDVIAHVSKIVYDSFTARQ